MCYETTCANSEKELQNNLFLWGVGVFWFIFLCLCGTFKHLFFYLFWKSCGTKMKIPLTQLSIRREKRDTLWRSKWIWKFSLAAITLTERQNIFFLDWIKLQWDNTQLYSWHCILGKNLQDCRNANDLIALQLLLFVSALNRETESNTAFLYIGFLSLCKVKGGYK